MSETNKSDQAGSTFDYQIARMAVGGYVGAQTVRKSMMNRIRDVVRKRNEEISFDQVEEEKEEDSYDSKYDDENLPDMIEKIRDEDKLTDHEFDYLQKVLQLALDAEDMEDRYEQIMKLGTNEPIYTQFLDNVYGVGHILTARLLHKFGYCENFDRVGHLWSYSGLAPGQQRRRGEQANFDPEAKTLGWLIATNMIRQGSRSRYRTEFYEPYKQKQVNRMEMVEDIDYEIRQIENEGGNGTIPATFRVKERPVEGSPVVGEQLFTGSPPKSDGHAEMRAKRYLAKKFLKHYWAITRDLKGLDVPDEYIIAFGGHEKETESFENPFYAKRELMG